MMSVLPERALLGEICEVFDDNGICFSFYEVRAADMVGITNVDPIVFSAILLARSVKVDDEFKEPSYFLELPFRSFNALVEKLKLK